MSNKETKDFLDQCSQLHQNSSIPTEEPYSPPMLSTLDVDQIIAYGGCSPEPCSGGSGTATAAATMGLSGVA